MIKRLIYFSLAVDLGLIFLIPGLKWIYGIKEGEVSPAAFSAWRDQLVPTRDAYFLIAFAASAGLTIVLGSVAIRRNRKLKLLELVGLSVAIITILLLIITRTSIPRGGILGIVQ